MLRSYGQFFICIVWIIVAGGLSPVSSSTFLYDGPKLNCIDCLQLDSTTTTTVPSTTTHPTTVPTTTETTTAPTTTQTITVPATTQTITVPTTTVTITVPTTTVTTATVPTTTVIDSTTAISTVPSEVIVPKITTAKGNTTTRLPDVTGSTLRSGSGSTVTDKNKEEKKPEKDKHKNSKKPEENQKKTKKAKFRRCYKKKITEEVNETSAEKFHRYMDYIFSDNVMVCLYAISLGIPLIVAFVLVVLKGKVYYEKEKKKKTRIPQSSRPGVAPKSEVLTPV